MVPADMRTNPATQHGMKIISMEEAEMELVDTAFETDQLFLHVLPDPYREDLPNRVTLERKDEQFQLRFN